MMARSTSPDRRAARTEVFVVLRTFNEKDKVEREDLGGGGAASGELAPIHHRRNRIRMTCFSMSSELLMGLTLVSAELRQTTGTSAIFTPCLRARYSTSGS